MLTSFLAFPVPAYAAPDAARGTKPAKPATDRAAKLAAAKARNAAKLAAKAEANAPAPASVTRLARNLARDAATVQRQATNFGSVTDRDAAYRQFFGRVMRANGNAATLAQIDAGGIKRDGKSYNPDYAGSAKATDAGAINRAIKAGYFTASDNGSRLTATPLALADKHYLGKA
jgi:hypothetical protein